MAYKEDYCDKCGSENGKPIEEPNQWLWLCLECSHEDIICVRINENPAKV